MEAAGPRPVLRENLVRVAVVDGPDPVLDQRIERRSDGAAGRPSQSLVRWAEGAALIES